MTKRPWMELSGNPEADKVSRVMLRNAAAYILFSFLRKITAIIFLILLTASFLTALKQGWGDSAAMFCFTAAAFMLLKAIGILTYRTAVRAVKARDEYTALTGIPISKDFPDIDLKK